jgi:nitronate monooxygenase
MLRTELTGLLDLQYPIVQAPMAGGPTTPGLVAAVSAAGGLGVYAGSGVAPDLLAASIAAIRARTAAPFGVNFLIAPPEGGGDIEFAQSALDRLREELGLPRGARDIAVPPSLISDQLDVVLSERVPVLSFALGDPAPFAEAAHEAGVLVCAMVTTVEEAVRVVEGGADLVVAQGAEAGGHRSTFDLSDDRSGALVGTLALVPQIVDAVAVPVIAAGGIVDGRGLAAALALGAAGAQLGTRFLLAAESATAQAYRAALVRAVETDTVVTSCFTGRPARAIRNRFVAEQATTEPLPWPLQRFAAEDIYRAAAERGDEQLFPLLAGQGLRSLRDGQRAAEIVAEIAEQATAVLDSLAAGSGPERHG